MSYIEYKYEDPSNDTNVLNISVRLISEQIEQEITRGESADNRTNIAFCLIGIYVSIILAISNVLFGESSNPAFILKLFFISIVILLASSIFNALKVILVKQVEKLSPGMVNDIQSFSETEALQYEVKWKMWQYNKLNESNTTKLFYLNRIQRSLLFSILNLLIMIPLIYFNKYIFLYEIEHSWLSYVDISIGVILFLFSIFSNKILESYSFWNEK